MSDIHYGRGYVYSIQYHLVWCVKYRHDILHGQIDTDVKTLLKQIAIDNDIQIVEMESDQDHIHLLIDCKPQHYIPSIVKAFKGVSARLLFKKHPELKQHLWGGHLWNPSYFVATVSENTEEQIRSTFKIKKRNEVSYVLRHKASSFRIYPNQAQQILIAKTIGCSRFIFNHFLSLWNETYRNTGKGLTYHACATMLPHIKKNEETNWLKEVDSIALQSSLKNLSNSFSRFFKKQTNKP